MNLSDTLTKIRDNINLMNNITGFSVIIVCCSNSYLSSYWQTRLECGRGSVISENTLILTVFEDWPGGAGNGLGTLYAYNNAVKLAKERYNMNLTEELKTGKISIGLYHTAGKGTRLAPLPASENNNKPGVKLPGIITINNNKTNITILEAVIKQTGCYASSRMGRVSVFWGDQIFIPTVSVTYSCRHHIDILCSLGPMLSEEEWIDRGMDKYGLIAQMADGRGAQVEKVTHATAVKLLSDLGDIKSVGVSLGSFSISSIMLIALLSEFEKELIDKKGKLDTDPHFWMPMTLSKESYIYLMEQKKVSMQQSSEHYDRIKTMLIKYDLENFTTAASTNNNINDNITGLFSSCDVGSNIYWWDYGQLKFYQKYCKMITEKSDEAECMRLFFNTTNDDNKSCLLNTVILSTNNNIQNSVVCNVKCNTISANNCILMNVVARNIIAASGSILYNIITDGDININENEVQVGVYNNQGEQMLVSSNMDIDGGVYWYKPVVEGQKTFDEIYTLNETIDPLIIEKIMLEKKENIWNKINEN